MLFLFQSFGRKYGKPPTALLRQADKKPVILVDDSDDELLAAWFTFMARYYEKSDII